MWEKFDFLRIPFRRVSAKQELSQSRCGRPVNDIRNGCRHYF
jgi:hypothetical protein